MKVLSRWVLVSLAIMMFGVSPADAGSIWAKAGYRTRALYTDDTAREVGDVLTIIISEHSIVENETKRILKKKSSRDFSASGTFPVDDVPLLRRLNWLAGRLLNLPDTEFEMDAENKFDGKADFDSDRKIVDQITVIVIDVLPNGNLLVVGSRSRGVSNDTQTVEISGIVRPSDITFANTVKSNQVADFRIVLRHKGQENRFTNPGWLEWLMNNVNPF
ncbi:MAG TPA: flagellar basal body L-ring protein FlgH [Phycisphaerae bacterium]|nr:flagellar basal body L-ring protein FlgH [Phycisphaerae bacterium]